MKTIKINKEVKYLGEAIQELPSNCLFDKGKVGCGGTTLAITSPSPYVICVPFVSLIENKSKQHSNVLGVYSGVSVDEIIKYVEETKVPKIMVTYDSIDKVIEAIEPSKYKLLVDEYHLLFMQYSFREKAISKVLNSFKDFKEYCFMTATVLEDEFILTELQDLEVVVAKWENIVEVGVNSVLCPKGVLNSSIDLVRSYLDNSDDENAYIFINSVKFIKEILKNIPELNESNCNIIYSKYNKAELRIKRGEILEKGKHAKKVNFLTSTAFEGCDIYDEKGNIYIISDGKQEHTLVDISTSFQQIAGRVRNSKHLGNITHLYTNTRYISVSYDEYKNLIEKEITKTKAYLNSMNALPEEARNFNFDLINIEKANSSYIQVNEDGMVFNENLVKVDLYNFKVCRFLYKIRVSNLENELRRYNFNVKNYQHNSTVSISKKDLVSFKATVKELETELVEGSVLSEIAFQKYDFLEEAINKMGFDGIKEMKYKQSLIKRKLVSMENDTKINKVLKSIQAYSDVKSGSFVGALMLKKRFASIYSDLHLRKVAKGSDIEEFFNVKKTSRRINGVKTAGYELLNVKLLII